MGRSPETQAPPAARQTTPGTVDQEDHAALHVSERRGMQKTVVAVATPPTARFFEPMRSGVESLGYRVRSYDEPTAFLNDASTLSHAEVLLATGSVPIGAGVLSRAPRLRSLVSPGTGTEGFDLAAATERGIVANGHTRENVESMAEATVLSMTWA
jgi:lactate dehydrogenase-like 2-hydroxyacid dehydrogenase